MNHWDLNYKTLACDIVRALRGRRSQAGLSKILGFAKQRISHLEAGKSELKWREFVAMAKVSDRDLAGALRQYFHFEGSPDDCAGLIRHAVGTAAINDMAKETGVSRFKISRWLSGESEPGFVEIVRFLDLRNLTILDFLQTIAAPKVLTSLSEVLSRRDRERQLYVRYPEASVLIRLLETKPYLAAKRHDETVLSRLLRLPIRRVRTIVDEMAALGVIQLSRGLYRPIERKLYVDAARGSLAAYNYWLKRTCLLLDQERRPGQWSKFGAKYAAVSDAAMQQVMRRYIDFYGEVTKIVEQDAKASDRVVMMNFAFIAVDELPPP